MTFLSVNPQGLLFCSPANENTGFSLSHSCIQMPESDPDTLSDAPILTITCVLYGRIKRNHPHLFLDFKENFPHSNLQNDTHDD